MDDLAALRLFIRVARLGSFSRAAAERGLSQPSASRIIAALEARLGTALFTRSTRALTLTDAGGDYLASVAPLVEAIDAAGQALTGDGELRGRLRVAMPTSFGSREVVPLLPGFTARHPALAIDLAMADARVDLVAEGIDIALRLGALDDSTALARRLLAAPRILVAAPAYLAAAGTPRSPGDLAGHQLIAGPAAVPGGWAFRRDGRVISVRAHGRLSIASNDGAVAAAVAGLGIVRTSLFGCRRELAAGSLQRLLEDWPIDDVPLHAVFPAGRAASPAARAFADYLEDGLRRALTPFRFADRDATSPAWS
ncbi:LysR family transcriptional regulator [alpha proteobacterium AAP81b]|nr:LysR family transcriptional regulator [alpha proteobacterium AAP81b]